MGPAETRWRLELIAERVAARDGVEPLTLAERRAVIDEDPELAWLREADESPELVWDGGGDDDEVALDVERPPAMGEQLPLPIPLPTPRPRAERKRYPKRKWLPRENRRVQLRRLKLTPGTYRPGRVVGHLSRKERRTLQAWPRPKTWGECMPGSKGRWWGDAPCPYLSCRANLGLDVSAAGSIRVVLGVGDGRGSCALELAIEGTRTLEEVAELDGCTREAVRLVEASALLKIRRAVEQ